MSGFLFRGESAQLTNYLYAFLKTLEHLRIVSLLLYHKLLWTRGFLAKEFKTDIPDNKEVSVRLGKT
jgi:hypothetical protein